MYILPMRRKASWSCGVLGDSHAALFGQGCMTDGMLKATYGTGSSIMINIGEQPIFSTHGLVTSLAWKYKGKPQYVMEGNLNYTGAVISWLQKDLKMVNSPQETQTLSQAANPSDTTYLVPAFTGLGAPYWNSDAKAAIYGITRLTSKAEFVKAAVECIAYQIADVIVAVEQDTAIHVDIIRVDGGATNNEYLMQFQSDILQARVQKAKSEELSGIGAAYMAGISYGIYDSGIQNRLLRQEYTPQMSDAERNKKYAGWCKAVRVTLSASKNRID